MTEKTRVGGQPERIVRCWECPVVQQFRVWMTVSSFFLTGPGGLVGNSKHERKPMSERSCPDPDGSPLQPMGTEPKDGTRFLCYVSENEIHSASWYCQKLCGSPGGPWGYPNGIGLHRAKYWMPIPQIPPANSPVLTRSKAESRAQGCAFF